MVRKMFILVLLITVLTSVNVFASDQQEKNQHKATPFSADYACFKGNEKQTYVEIYNQVDLNDLQMTHDGISYYCDYELKYTIYKDGALVREFQFDDLVNFDHNDEKGNKTRLNVQGILLQPGYYSCDIQLTDKATQKSQARPLFLDIPDFAVTKLIMSDIQIARSIYSTKQKNAFVKNGLFVKPNIYHSFDYFAAEMFVYYEIYGLTKEKNDDGYNADITCKIRKSNGALKKEIKHSVKHPTTDAVHSLRMSILELVQGEYELEIQIKDKNSKEKAINRTRFNIGWPDDFSQRDFVFDMIDQLKYVAPQWNFSGIITLPQQKQRAAILSFWKGRDPSPETAENELMDEFYKRVSFANKYFKQCQNKGWKSDKGKVYIQNGQPLTVYRLYSQTKQNAYEVWKYENQDKRFIFVDHMNFGDFRLIPQDAVEYFELE